MNTDRLFSEDVSLTKRQHEIILWMCENCSFKGSDIERNEVDIILELVHNNLLYS